jgi:hypothetical protein
MAALNDPNTSAEDITRLNREAHQLLKPRGMVGDMFVREALANSPLPGNLFPSRYSHRNARTFLDNLLKDAVFDENRDDISAFAMHAVPLFGRDTASFEETLRAMEQSNADWDSYVKGLGLSQEQVGMLNAMRDTWTNADTGTRDIIRHTMHRMHEEANLDNDGVVAKAQQEQAFMSSFLARQGVNLDSTQISNDNSVLLGLFGEGGAVSDEAALVYGMTRQLEGLSNGGAGRFKFDEKGNVVDVNGNDIWDNENILKLLDVTNRADATARGITTRAGFIRHLAELHRQGSVVSQSSDGMIFVGTRDDAQKARQSMTEAVDSTGGMRVVRGMFAGVNVSDFRYNSNTGAYSFRINGAEKLTEGADAMRYLHQRVLQDPTLRKELEFLADASNGANEATRKQAQRTLTAIRALDAARSFNFGFNKFEKHWYGNTDERGTLDRLFWDQRNGAADFTALVNAYLANPTDAFTEAMAKRLDFIDAIRGYNKEELTARNLLDEDGNWTQLAADMAGVDSLKGKPASDDQFNAISRASRADGPSGDILQLLSRVISGDRLKVTST